MLCWPVYVCMCVCVYVCVCVCAYTSKGVQMVPTGGREGGREEGRERERARERAARVRARESERERERERKSAIQRERERDCVYVFACLCDGELGSADIVQHSMRQGSLRLIPTLTSSSQWRVDLWAPNQLTLHTKSEL